MTGEEEKIRNEHDIETPEDLQVIAAPASNGQTVWIDPDLKFISALSKNGSNPFKMCMQCGTCSSTCDLSPDDAPFPGKEMAWAAWGMKDRLMGDVDVWLCYQCNDCSTRCPRGAKPGDMMAAVRQENIIQSSFPRFFARWVSQPAASLFLLALPAALLGGLLYAKEPLAAALGIVKPLDDKISFSYNAYFPHWLLNSFFLTLTFLVIVAFMIGTFRMWKSLKSYQKHNKAGQHVKSMGESIRTVIKEIFTHNNFSVCTSEKPRFWSHTSVFYGFIALFFVSLWAMTSGINPLLKGAFVYPFNFWSPWKILANLGGASLLFGLSLMTWDRIKIRPNSIGSSYFDIQLIGLLLLVVLSGFATEALHYFRLEPHRHLIYFAHLVFAASLIMYLPYSKLAHIVYRTIALVYAEMIGRKRSISRNEEVVIRADQNIFDAEKQEDVEKKVEAVTS